MFLGFKLNILEDDFVLTLLIVGKWQSFLNKILYDKNNNKSYQEKSISFLWNFVSFASSY